MEWGRWQLTGLQARNGRQGSAGLGLNAVGSDGSPHVLASGIVMASQLNEHARMCADGLASARARNGVPFLATCTPCRQIAILAEKFAPSMQWWVQAFGDEREDGRKWP